LRRNAGERSIDICDQHHVALGQPIVTSQQGTDEHLVALLVAFRPCEGLRYGH
jgi:hypothetical protein